MPRVPRSYFSVKLLLVVSLLVLSVGLPGGRNFLSDWLPSTVSAAAPDIQTTCSANSFVAARSFSQSQYPQSVASGDFNGDSRADVVMGISNSNKISVMLSNGGDSFTAPTSFTTGTRPISVAVGDFNNDFKLDIVTANYLSNDLSIFLGDGAGGFAAAVNLATPGANPTFVLVEDLNHDDNDDVAVGHGNGLIGIMLGNGSGSFGSFSSFTGISGLVGMLTGDFDLDGYSDLAVATTFNQIAIYPGNALGGFGPATSVTAGSELTDLAAADFNNDGKLDLAVSIYFNDLAVLLNNGNGTFAARTLYPMTGISPTSSLVVGDINNDGNIDLAGTNNSNVSVRFGNGAGSFGAPTNYAAPVGPSYLKANDFNSDGSLDLVIAAYSSTSVSLLANDGTGGFITAVRYAAGAGPNSVVKGDFNNDGKVDLAVSNRDSNDVSILLGSGTGTFGAATNFSVGPPPPGFAGNQPFFLASGDFNGDSMTDLVTANFTAGGVSILLGDGAGNFPSAQKLNAGTFAWHVAVGEFNSDGKQDLVITGNGSNHIAMMLGDGNGNFAAPVNFSGLQGPRPIALADLNADTKTDIVVGNQSGMNEVAVLLGNGSGGFTAPANYTLESFARPSSIAISDLNGDTKPDLIVAEEGMDRVAFLAGNGSGGFLGPVMFNVGDEPGGVEIADFNGDSFRDVAVANSSSSNISLLLGNGSGGFSNGPTYLSRGPRSLVTADFNGDGRIDLATDGIDVINSTCVDTSAIPSSAITVNDISVSEESASVTFALTLSPASAQSVTVQYHTSGQSGVSGADFQSTSGGVTFLMGETAKNVVVPLINDSINEFTERFNLNLHHPVNAAILKRQGTASITDSDPEPSLSLNDVNINEGNTGTTSVGFTVSLSSPSGKLVSLNYATADGTAMSGQDYAATSGATTIGAGATTQQVAVVVNGDIAVEPDESIFLNLSSAVRASIADSQGIATIVNDDSLLTVVNTDDSGAGSLRQAMLDANANAGLDQVIFNIPGAGVHTINLLSALPEITSPISIDATTQPGFAGTPIVELNGAAAGGSADGLVVKAGGSTIKGLVVGRFSGFGIWLFFCNDNTIQGNYIGVDPTGTLRRANSTGILFSASSNNLIGGTTAAARNVISANSFDGVEVSGSNNLVQGNFIGTDATGAVGLSNGTIGLEINGPSSTNNIIGGTVPGARNLISGNQTGVRINGQGNMVQGNLIGTNITGTISVANGLGIHAVTANNLIGGTTPAARNIISGNNGGGVFLGGSNTRLQGNFIGTDITGTVRLANGGSGVVAGNLAVIGGTTPGAGNVISGNGGFGNISLGSNSSGSSATVQGNLIGTDVTGSVALTNPAAGISISGSSNLIGGTTLSARNIISGNRSGIELGGSIAPGPTGNTIVGNIIGLNAAGTAALPNLLGGIRISATSSNTIGTTASGAGNIIRSNSGPGVIVFSGTRNSVRGNSIDANGELGIDLDPAGVTTNDAGDADSGANNLQNFPLLTQVTSNANSTAIQGTLNSTANATFEIDFYSNASCDASGNGEGEQFLGTTTVTTDGSGNVTFSASVSPLSSGRVVAATATDSLGNTSEFSPCQANQTGFFSFSQPAYSVGESSGSITITVNRTNNQSGAATINYTTLDNGGITQCATVTGFTSARCDYTTALGTLHFAAGESAKTFTVLISQDSYVEGPESLTLMISNPTGATVLGSPASATLTITDDASEPPANPINDAEVFVRQHYHDFLNREPDAAGLAFWSNQITECQQPGATCSVEIRRINVSAAFFLSIEFQETGYLVERIYKSAYGEASGTSNFGPTHQLPVPVVRFSEFLPDTQQIGLGVVVGEGDWQTRLENNKVAFTQDFVTRARFVSAYPTTLTAAEYVDGLFSKAGVTPSAAERSSIIGEFGGAGTSAETAARARALRRVAEHSTLKQLETNKAFVLMQYFGYLRRNPNDAPDADYTGYDFWLTKLNEFNGNFVNAEMVKAFIVSGEYRQRYGP